MPVHPHARPDAAPKPPPDPETPPPIEDPMPPEPPIEEPEPDRTVPVAGRAVYASLGLLLLLAGCQQAVTPEEPVNRRPELNLVAEPDNGPAPLTVELSANARDPEGRPLTYTWSVTGTSPEAGEVLTYTFEEPGEYTVELTVSDGRFDSETDSVTVFVYGADEPKI